MTSFPEYHFPLWWNIHDCRANHCTNPITSFQVYGSGRAFVTDWGRLGCINVAFPSTSDSTSTFQTAFQPRITTSFPIQSGVALQCRATFPFLDSPNILADEELAQQLSYAAYMNARQNIQYVEKVIRSNLVSELHNLVSEHRKRLYRQLFTALQSLDRSDITQQSENDFLLLCKRHFTDALMKVVQQPDMFNKSYLQTVLRKVHPLYSGGCLDLVPMPNSNSDHLLAYLSGPKMQSICFALLQDAVTVNSLTRVLSWEVPVLQVHLSPQGDLLVRHPTSLRHLANVFGDSSTDTSVLVDTHGEVFSTTRSPFFPEELLYTVEDRVTVHSLEGNCDVSNVTLYPVTSNDHAWNMATFHEHPRSVLYTDRSRLCLLDLRCPSGQGQQELFSLPKSYVNAQERIYFTHSFQDSYQSSQWSSRVPSHYSTVFCDFSHFLVDDRMPNLPVLQWTSSLRQPVQMASAVSLPQRPDLTFLLEATQISDEAAVLPFSHLFTGEGRDPPVIAKLPMQLPSLDTVLEGVRVGSDVTRIRQRLGDSVCLGFRGLALDARQLLTVRLTNFGDLLTNIVRLGEEDEDEEEPMSATDPISRESEAYKSKEWITTLRQSLRPSFATKNLEFACRDPAWLEHRQTLHCQGLISDKLATPVRLACCPLCRAGDKDMEGISTHFRLQTSLEQSHVKCRACGLPAVSALDGVYTLPEGVKKWSSLALKSDGALEEEDDSRTPYWDLWQNHGVRTFSRELQEQTIQNNEARLEMLERAFLFMEKSRKAKQQVDKNEHDRTSVLRLMGDSVPVAAEGGDVNKHEPDDEQNDDVISCVLSLISSTVSSSHRRRSSL